MQGGKSANAAEKRFWGELKNLGCICCGAPGCEIHHPLGSTFKFNKVHIGNWFVLAVCDMCHRNDPINMTNGRKRFFDGYRKQWNRWELTDKEVEKELYWNQLKRYQFQLDKEHPVPEEVVEMIKVARR